MKLLIELDEEYVKVIDKIEFLVGGRTNRKLQLEIIKAIKNGKLQEQEQTTKNDLGVTSELAKNSQKLENVSPIIDWNNCHTSEQLESISRQRGKGMRIEEIEKLPAIIDMLLSESVIVDTKEKLHEKLTEVCNLAIKALEQEQTFKWCTGCNEYDQEKHCCHRWSKVIRDAVKALEQEPRLIPVSERLPEPNRLVLCYITTGVTETYFLAMRNEYYDDWEEGIGGSRLLGMDLGYKVLAWMPLPKPYEPQESEG